MSNRIKLNKILQQRAAQLGIWYQLREIFAFYKLFRPHRKCSLIIFMYPMENWTLHLFREDSLIDFVGRNVPRPLPPSSRNVKFQNDPLIVVSIAVSKGKWALAKHAPRIILMNGDQGYRMNIINITFYTFFGCNFIILS